MPKSAAYQFTIARFDALAMGGILALAVRDKYYLNLADRHAGILAYLSFIYVALVVVFWRESSARNGMLASCNQSVAALLFAYSVLRLLTPGRLFYLARAAGLIRYVRVIGLYSYAT